ncbi:MAG TPA: hypothetical protein VH301_15355 [Usitatibacter sp.]|nr:hypothetical protein [Usitatibacter sp.]
MSPISQELALGMALALASAEADLARVSGLIGDRADPAESRQLAMQLLTRALRRVQTVKDALDDACEACVP